MAIDVASGRKRRIILTGIFDKSFQSNDIIAYIQIVSGSIKAHEYAKEDTDLLTIPIMVCGLVV